MTRRTGSSHPKHPLTNLTALKGHILASRAVQRLVFPSKGTEKPLTDYFLYISDHGFVITGNTFALDELATHLLVPAEPS